ncbi:filamentous hemagglutinin family protein [Herbaspirillum sp. SJZ130]|nr:filamentous hemagglutinin family protein [Herbaspirillum sp. SJZ130]TQK08610.1 filamentous hemagglutinin family protein [Herbaspirillum sp. SJZ106]
MKQHTPFHLRRNALAVTMAAAFGAAQANPVAPTVVNGAATFSQQGNQYTITNTPNTIINWNSFSIAAGEITRFIQQGGDSRVLNRITGQDPSQILGSLQSNGKVFLINPNGVIFGAGSRVDVNGLVASSLNISNADFLAGKNIFSGSDSAGKVSNQGTITTPSGGQIFLIGPSVENSGIISSPNGDVVLAAGKSVQLFDSADPNVQVVVSAPSDQALNLGSIVAQGGRVGVYGALINQRGIINANSAVRGENGKIVLKASDTTMVEAGSVTSATGSNLNSGGEIMLLGAKVGVAGNAVVDASGESGGGKVLVGGDYQGKNAAVMNADAVYVGQDATIRADATQNGNGGTVVVWGRDATRMYGTLTARGGAAGGNGGLVETSGGYLDVAGARVNTSAAAGKIGNWLLDPYDIAVVSGRGGALTDVATFDTGPASGVTSIGADLISESMSNVVLQAKHDITFNSAIFNSANVSLTAQAGNDIQVNAPIDMYGGITLSANDAASGSASGTGGVTVANLGGIDALSTYGSNATLKGSYVTINGAVSMSGGNFDAHATVAGGVITLGANGNISSSAGSNSSLSFTADNINLNGSVTGSIINIDTYSTSTGINLGAKVAGQLSLTNAELNRLDAPILNIGQNTSHSAALTVASAIDLTNSAAGYQQLNLRGNLITVSDALKTRGQLTLDGMSGSVSGAGPVTANSLVVNAGSVALTGSNMAGGISGSATTGNFGFTAANDLTINGNISGATGISLTAGGNINQNNNTTLTTPLLSVAAPGSANLSGTANRIGALTAPGIGSLTVNNADSIALKAITLTGIGSGGAINVTTPGNIAVDGVVDAKTQNISLSANNISGAGTLAGQALTLNTTGGVGSAASALLTRVAELTATNTAGANSVAPINIANTGNNTNVLIVHDVQQVDAGGGNGGAIKIANTGGMTTAGTVSTGAGAITLQANGPLAVNGQVLSDSGSIALISGPGYNPDNTLTIGNAAVVKSTNGTVAMTATAYTQNGGTVTDRNGPVTATLIPKPTPETPSDACAAAPNSPLCGALSLPTIAELARPAQVAINEVVTTLNAVNGQNSNRDEGFSKAEEDAGDGALEAAVEQYRKLARPPRQ